MMSDRQRELLEASQALAADFGLDAAEAIEMRALLAEHPELAAELENVHEWDEAIGVAYQDADVPVGLAARLREAVATELQDAEKVSLAAITQPASKIGRRSWLFTMAGVAAAILLAVGVYIWQRPHQVLSASVVQEMESLDLESIHWQAVAQRPKLPRDLSATAKNWGYITTSLDRQAVVYSFVAADSKNTAILIVQHVPRATGDLPNRVPYHPHSMTGGMSMGAWQQGDYVYVLIVKGKAPRYQSFLNDPSPLT